MADFKPNDSIELIDLKLGGYLFDSLLVWKLTYEEDLVFWLFAPRVPMRLTLQNTASCHNYLRSGIYLATHCESRI